MVNPKDYKHYAVYILLVIVIVWALSRGKPDRYALSSEAEGGTYVLDTRTGQLWERGRGASIYLGTNENPKCEIKWAERTKWRDNEVVVPAKPTGSRFGPNDVLVEE